MNPSDDPTQDELANRLDRLATTIDLRQGALDAVRRRGEQRVRRRRTAIGGLSVVAVVSASIAGIAVLSRPTDPTITHHAADEGVPPASGDSLPGATDTAATTAATTVDTATATEVVAATSLDLVDSDVTWTLVRPDSTQALAYPSTLSGVMPSNAPLYVYSSAPGRDDGGGGPATLYRSDDGINWSVVDTAELPERASIVGALATSPDTVYAMSTAPSSAAGEPAANEPASSGAVASTIVGGSGADVLFSTRGTDGTWTETVVPLDTASWLGVTGVVGAWPSELSASSIDHDGSGAVAVMARTVLQLDVSAIGVDQMLDSVQILPSGVDVSHFDEACTGVATTAVFPAGAAGTVDTIASDTAATDAVETTPGTSCDGPTVEHHDLSELGVDQRALDEYFAPPHLFISSGDGSFVEVPFPGTVAEGHLLSAARLVALGDQHALVYDEIDPADYTLTATHLFLSSDGEQWDEVVLPVGVGNSWGGFAIGRLADGRIAGVATQASAPWHLVAFADDGAGGWTTTDLTGALRPEDGRSAYLMPGGAVVGDTGITVSAMIGVDPFVENGPVSTTDGDRTISLVDSMGTYVVTSTATGEEIARIQQGQTDPTEGRSVRYEDNGDVVLVDAATGDEIARVSAAVQQELSTAVYGGAAQPATIVLHSTDGLAWSRESLADLGSTSATWVNSLSSIDGRILATYLDPGVRNDDGSPATFVLIGTPNG